MSERRSGRSRKQVDYSKFAADIDNDDDFADSTPPPSKKQRKAEKTEEKKDISKSSKASSDRPTTKKSRLPLDDKLYERDLQAALEMSVRDSPSQPELGAGDQDRVGSGQAVLHSTPLPGVDSALHRTDLESQTLMPSAIPLPPTAVPRSHALEHNDNIEFLGTVTCSDSDSPAKPCIAARKRKTCVINDDDDDESSHDFSDGAESSDGDSGSDFDDADSDFDDSKSKSKTKGKVKGVPTKKKPAATEKKSSAAPVSKSKAPKKPCSVPAPVMTRTPAAASTPASTVKSPVSPACVRMCAATTPSPAGSRASTPSYKAPAWTAPGHSESSSSSNTSASLKSPSSGLRLGLSRRASTKPLHPSLKVS
ncbi:RAD51-associated protein 1-like [Littorina saxatilis]|uniref:RAD51 interacting motif domain-containing protein n=1 Tax=Littorina saxatilis TaxID=31220 RepID=A0AAN9B3V4_9CAEN